VEPSTVVNSVCMRANMKEKVVGRVIEYLQYCAIWMRWAY